MNKSEVMTRAWEIRKAEKTTMSVSLKKAWAEAKNTTIKAVGNTYSVKDYLKSVGFSWNPETKEWTAKSFDSNAWNTKYCSPSWNGRREARNCESIKFIAA